MTDARPNTGPATRPGPVFPYSIYGAPRSCTCRWEWRFDVGRFVVTCPAEGCIWHLTEQQPRSKSRATTATGSPTARPR